MADNSNGGVRYKNLLRLLAVLSLDGGKNYADRCDEVLDKVSNEDIADIFFGKPDQIIASIIKHDLPANVVDLICILVDGHPMQTISPQEAENIVGVKHNKKKSELH